MATGKDGVVSFDCPDLACDSVTVYSDRAEVKRIIKTKLKKGTSAVVVKKLPRVINKDSIRVEGKGKAMIWEVQYQEKTETQPPTPAQKKEEQLSKEEVNKKKLDIRTQISALKREKDEIDSSKTLIQHQEKIFKTATAKVAENKNTGKVVKGKDEKGRDEEEALTVFTIGDEHIESVDKFLAFYAKTAGNYHEQIWGFNFRMEDISRKIKDLEEERDNLKPKEFKTTSQFSREVSITVEASEESVCELTVAYMVKGASWKASYDFRVFTEDKLIKVYYYAMIRQESGEDWKNAKLSLTTAEPRIQGDLPVLKTLKARITGRGIPTREASDHEPRRRESRKKVAVAPMDPCYQTLRIIPDDPCYQSLTGLDDHVFGEPAESSAPPKKPAPEPPNPKMVEPTAHVRVPSGPGFSANFDIARRSSIPSDETDHKVNVGILSLSPVFIYEIVPSKSPNVYQKIRVTNNSTYILLPGSTQIFVNNNFVAKGELSLVSPMEEFSCSLGIEPMIKAEYKPKKFNEERRRFTGKTVTETTANKTELKNTTKEAVKVKLMEQVPLSEDEKIKVNLLEPQLALEGGEGEKKEGGEDGGGGGGGVGGKEAKPYSLNPQHNLEWDLDVGPGKTRTVQVKYTLSYPKTEEIELVEG